MYTTEKSTQRNWSSVIAVFLMVTALAGIGYRIVKDRFASASVAAVVSSPYEYSFNVDGVLEEAHTEGESTSPYWWLASGGRLYISGGLGKTIQGDLPEGDSMKAAYAASSPALTDNGLHPQNAFQIFTRSSWNDFQQSAYFRIVRDNLATNENRKPENGLFLLSRSQGDNMYWGGVRMDGSAVIGKKVNGVSYAIAQVPGVFSGSYDRTNNSNLLPEQVWTGVRLDTVTVDGKVKFALYTDAGKTGIWKRVAEGTDDGSSFGGAILANAGYAGIKSDFMDVEFDDFIAANASSVAANSASSNAGGYALTASVPSAPVAVNAATEFTFEVTNSGANLSDALVDFEIYNTAGQKVFQKFFEHQTLATNQKQTYKAQWTAPATGEYKIKAGIFTANWAANPSWHDNLFSFSASTVASTGTVNPPTVTASQTAQSTQTVNNPAAANGFVTVDRSTARFMLNGQPFMAAGTNSYYLMQDYTYGRSSTADSFDMYQKLGINVVRTWGFADGTRFSHSGDPVILQESPGVYREKAFAAMDHVINEAGKRGVRLIIPLVNYWDNFGGMNQYVAWAGRSGRDAFYTDSTAKQLYKNYVRDFLNRRNTLNGKLYKDDPAIMAWELANEAKVMTNPGGAIMEGWYREMAQYVKSLDSNHLIGTGEEGFEATKDGYSSTYDKDWLFSGSEGTGFTRNTAIPEIDFAGVHLYPHLWGLKAADGDTWIRDHAAVARKYGKPLLVGEFGYSKDHESVYRSWLSTAKAAGNVTMLVWELNPESRAAVATVEETDVVYPREAGKVQVIADAVKSFAGSQNVIVTVPPAPTAPTAPATTPTATATNTTPVIISSAPSVTSEEQLLQGLSSDITLQETGSLNESASAGWWLNSGGYWYMQNGVGSTVQGSLPANDPWRLRYAASSAWDTDNGYHPQNLFRLFTKQKSQNVQQEAYFMVTKDNLSSSSNRNASNGLLLMSRYQNGNALYYAGLRVDGLAIIKKKVNGVYYTLAQKIVFPGNYHRSKNPNLLPHNNWMGIRTETVNNTDGSVTIKVYMDNGRTGNWQLVTQATDAGSQGARITAEGHNGIRTDFMDVKVDGYKATQL